ncbi:class D sortase [Amylibacter sp.]|nr:class D sortase [Amylibacter sp.]
MYKKIFVVLGYCLIILGLVGITKAGLMPIKAIIGQHYLEVAWKESLKSNKLSKPWKSADFYMVGELKVPKLKVSRVILNSVSGEAMAWSIGRVTNLNHALDKQPIILAGHRDSHMQFMSELNIGDKIELMMSDGVLKTYIISGTEVSDKPEVALSPVTLGSESLILTTCWPFNAIKSGDQRYLIFADKVNVSASIDNA